MSDLTPTNPIKDLIEAFKDVGLTEDELPSSTSGNCETMIRQIFDEVPTKYFTSTMFASHLSYSVVRVNKVLKKLTEEKFIVAHRGNKRNHYIRNVVDPAELPAQ